MSEKRFSYTNIRRCPHCNTKYECITYENPSGWNGIEEEEICPYCNMVISKSKHYDFVTRKLTEKED